MRSLKDFKAMITEKTVPKSIRTLKTSIFMLTLILIVVTSVDLILKNEQNNEFSETVNGLSYTYNRESLVADLIFYSRMIELIAR